MTYPYLLQNKPTIIGICGHARSGKDTVANRLQTLIPDDAYIFAFADALKCSMSEAFGLSLADPDINKEEVNEFWGVSPRQILQFAGTEIFRETLSNLLPAIGNDFWIKRHYGACAGLIVDQGVACLPYDSNDTIIIPDVRFPNELDYIRQNNGYIIHLTRPSADGTVGIPSHASEQNLSQHFLESDKYTAIFNHSTLQELYAQVDTFYNLNLS